MALNRLIAATVLALWPVFASGQASEWQRYVVAESGAAVDVPRDVFSDEAGKPETGYGARFLTSDRRANLTVQSVPNEGLAPARFFATKNPPSDIVYKKITDRFFVGSSIRHALIWSTRCNL